MPAQLVEQQPGVWQVSGAIDFDSVVPLNDVGCEAIEQAKDGCRFDFSAITSVNTAALALLLSWRRKALLRGTEVEFCHLPAELHAIAELSDLQSLVAASGP
ncbi:MAG: phospholipid transport system transporter-binding protein [Motiliproteus sp.]